MKTIPKTEDVKLSKIYQRMKEDYYLSPKIFESIAEKVLKEIWAKKQTS